MTSPSDAHNHIYMNLKDLQGHLRVSCNKTIYRWIETEGFPEPKKLGGLRRWDVAEVAEWVATHNSSKKQ